MIACSSVPIDVDDQPPTIPEFIDSSCRIFSFLTTWLSFLRIVDNGMPFSRFYSLVAPKTIRNLFLLDVCDGFSVDVQLGSLWFCEFKLCVCIGIWNQAARARISRNNPALWPVESVLVFSPSDQDRCAIMRDEIEGGTFIFLFVDTRQKEVK